MRENLQTRAEAREVHECEHVAQALVFLADQVADRAVEIQQAGRIAVDAHLVLERATSDRVAFADRAVFVGNELGYDEQRDTFRSRRRIRKSREHDVDDVFGEVVIA